MKIDYRHEAEGPGRVAVDCPFLVVITVDPEAVHRSAEVEFSHRWTAWTGPAGMRGDALGVEIDVPSSITSLKNKIRPGSYASGDDAPKGEPERPSRTSITIPPGCVVETRMPGRITVLHDGIRMSLGQAHNQGLLVMKVK